MQFVEGARMAEMWVGLRGGFAHGCRRFVGFGSLFGSFEDLALAWNLLGESSYTHNGHFLTLSRKTKAPGRTNTRTRALIQKVHVRTNYHIHQHSTREEPFGQMSVSLECLAIIFCVESCVGLYHFVSLGQRGQREFVGTKNAQLSMFMSLCLQEAPR